MRCVYLIHGYSTGLVIGVENISWSALILKGDSTVPVVLALNLDGDTFLMEYVKEWLERGNPTKREILVPLQDLPLYINWPYKTPEFMALLKAGCND